MAASSLPLLKVRFDHKIMLYVTSCIHLSSDMSMEIYEEEDEKAEEEGKRRRRLEVIQGNGI